MDLLDWLGRPDPKPDTQSTPNLEPSHRKRTARKSPWKSLICAGRKTSASLRTRMNYCRWKAEQSENRSIWLQLRKAANGNLIELESKTKQYSIPSISVSDLVSQETCPGRLPGDDLIDAGELVDVCDIGSGDELMIIRSGKWVSGLAEISGKRLTVMVADQRVAIRADDEVIRIKRASPPSPSTPSQPPS